MSDVMFSPAQVAALQAAYKNAGTTPGTALHGPGGLLGYYGLNRNIVNGMVMPRGLAGKLQVRGSYETNPIIPILTGLTATTGTENTTACADAPIVGSLKVCNQTFVFGRQSRESQVLQVDRVGQVINRGEFTDNVLIGKPLEDTNAIGPVNWNRLLQSELEKKMGELFIGYARDFARNLYDGNPSSTAGNTGYQEYAGLDILINTNKRDAITGIACPAADSTVVNFNGTNISTSGNTIYSYMAATYNKMVRLSQQTGMDPVEWALVMRWGAFFELTAIWPCVYATARCATGDIVRTSSLEEQTKFRDESRNGMYLLIEGKPVPIIIDDSIIETVPGAIGTYESDIYMVPLKASGTDITYLEYFNMQPEAIAAANAMAPTGSFAALSGGRFLLHRKPPSNECVQVRITERPRLMLIAPFLAARFTNVRYTITDNQHERDAFIGDPYFVNGGSTQAPLPYFYPPLG